VIVAVLCKLTSHALPYRCGDCTGYCIENAGMTVTDIEANYCSIGEPSAANPSHGAGWRRSVLDHQVTNSAGRTSATPTLPGNT
jgi:hypothetical protein